MSSPEGQSSGYSAKVPEEPTISVIQLGEVSKGDSMLARLLLKYPQGSGSKYYMKLENHSVTLEELNKRQLVLILSYSEVMDIFAHSLLGELSTKGQVIKAGDEAIDLNSLLDD